MLRRDHRVRDSREHGFDGAAVARTTTHALDDLDQRSSHGELADAGATDIARHRANLRSSRLRGADAPEPVGATGKDVRDIRECFDVVDRSGVRRIGAGMARLWVGGLPSGLRRGCEETELIRAQNRGKGIVAFDDLEQRRLLTEEVFLGSSGDRHTTVGANAGLLHLDNRPLERFDLQLEARLQTDERLDCADRECRDRQALRRIGTGSVEGACDL